MNLPRAELFPDSQRPLSSRAAERKRIVLPMVRAAQATRVGRRRVTVLVIAAVPLVVFGAMAVVWRSPVLIAPPRGPMAAERTIAPRVERPVLPVVESFRVAVVRNEPGAADGVRIGDDELRALLAEAGEPTGMIRMSGRLTAERDMVLVASNTEPAPDRPGSY